MDIKSQLYSFVSDLSNEISNYSTGNGKVYPNQQSRSLNIMDLIQNIKRSTSTLIDLKVSKVLSNNKNCICNNYYQLENYTKKLENDIRYLHQKVISDQIKINALEDKINIYRVMQVEFEELKEKVKYVGGKFLENEKKDNEILILRQENNILKKEITKLERIIKLNKTLHNNYINKISVLQKELKLLNKKKESKHNSNNSMSNYNSSNASNINIKVNNNNNDCTFSKTKFIHKHGMENLSNILPNNSSRQNNYNCLKGLKHLLPKNSFYNNKRPSNYNIIKNAYMNSNNNNKNIFNSTVSTISTNVFTSNYNKLLNNVSQKKKKSSSKKIKSYKKNNYITMKIDKEEEKSLLCKYLKRKKNNINESQFMYKSDRKKVQGYSKISNCKYSEDGPMSCRHQSSSKIRKSMKQKIMVNKSNKDFKIKKSNSALNININK